jgi:hypothetical protein
MSVMSSFDRFSRVYFLMLCVSLYALILSMSQCDRRGVLFDAVLVLKMYRVKVKCYSTVTGGVQRGGVTHKTLDITAC